MTKKSQFLGNYVVFRTIPLFLTFDSIEINILSYTVLVTAMQRIKNFLRKLKQNFMKGHGSSPYLKWVSHTINRVSGIWYEMLFLAKTIDFYSKTCIFE